MEERTIMNKELLKRLMSQSWEETELGFIIFNYEKFAELIVEECIEIVCESDSIISDIQDHFWGED
jgi:predicted hydrocarbon binding protein